MGGQGLLPQRDGGIDTAECSGIHGFDPLIHRKNAKHGCPTDYPKLPNNILHEVYLNHDYCCGNTCTNCKTNHNNTNWSELYTWKPCLPGQNVFEHDCDVEVSISGSHLCDTGLREKSVDLLTDRSKCVDSLIVSIFTYITTTYLAPNDAYCVGESHIPYQCKDEPCDETSGYYS
ncbi:hypothetical protein TL16_g02451 [Triparma laevis f. inornata]|uniref:Uncharacterized protein n=1 Tax=Triparma laevis f. inornata TaxID=1714386 RepID=A0A9W6ZR05_9STRA|nr:hypothetical protein TL16_g02451 [Triparma laevis f. inornata]